MSALRDELEKLRLSNDAIWERERCRPEVKAPWIIKGPYLVLCYALDAAFPENKPIQSVLVPGRASRAARRTSPTTPCSLCTSCWGGGAVSSELQRVHFAASGTSTSTCWSWASSLGGQERARPVPGAARRVGVLRSAVLRVAPVAGSGVQLQRAHRGARRGHVRAVRGRERTSALDARAASGEGVLDVRRSYLFDAFQSARPAARARRRASARCTTYSAPSATTRRSTSRRWGSARWRTARCPTWERWIWPPR